MTSFSNVHILWIGICHRMSWFLEEMARLYPRSVQVCVFLVMLAVATNRYAGDGVSLYSVINNKYQLFCAVIGDVWQNLTKKCSVLIPSSASSARTEDFITENNIDDETSLPQLWQIFIKKFFLSFASESLYKEMNTKTEDHADIHGGISWRNKLMRIFLPNSLADYQEGDAQAEEKLDDHNTRNDWWKIFVSMFWTSSDCNPSENEKRRIRSDEIDWWKWFSNRFLPPSALWCNEYANMKSNAAEEDNEEWWRKGLIKRLSVIFQSPKQNSGIEMQTCSDGYSLSNGISEAVESIRTFIGDIRISKVNEYIDLQPILVIAAILTGALIGSCCATLAFTKWGAARKITELEQEDRTPKEVPPEENTVGERNSKLKCPVCMDDEYDIEVSSKHFIAMFCGHLICNECLQNILCIDSQCPQCRFELTEYFYFKLYV